MIPVTNSSDYRRGYEWLGILTEALTKNYSKPETIRSEIANVKRELRRWAHRDAAVDVGFGFMVERRVVHDDGTDGFIELVSIPEVFETSEAAEEFFKDFIAIQYSPSMYDCTGQAFTSRFKLFRRHGQWFAYHFVSYDV